MTNKDNHEDYERYEGWHAQVLLSMIRPERLVFFSHGQEDLAMPPFTMSFLHRQESSISRSKLTSVSMDPCLRRGDIPVW